MAELKIIECPRDAMQGWGHFIPTEDKIAYLNQLLRVGFDTIDFGSFVSHKAIPQMADTARVVESVDMDDTTSKLLAIVANIRGAEEAMEYSQIRYLGYPFSVSPTFQRRNTNSSVEESFETVVEMHQLARSYGKEVVIYLSMAFGNPYGDEWSEKIVLDFAEQVASAGIHTISLADTVGLATPEEVAILVNETIRYFPDHEIGVHLHSTSENWRDKLSAALDNGCLRFDGAINGYGGCPMSGSDLVGNMNTGNMVGYFEERGYLRTIDDDELQKAEEMASKIFI
ncbi:MAG: hydroxymethylglutaryl-CoA lyase [Chitinophagaceae bacterium]|nr:hydroxymethylglutaryl-CoA lyase [Chitinophagaceae bacterium]MCW5914087.1 hydroxymethylglutaryl-CoA lyase [Chitinophagaceae bacterium]MCZ2396068.1 hydroxymethylglutaryl-CoA lyase [Chitinophagales bacterium]